MESVLDLLHTHLPDRHQEWNDTYAGGRVLLSRSEDSNIQYWAYNFSSVLIKSRDFVVNHRRIDRDGLVLIETDAVHPEAPVNPGFIRCAIPFNVRCVDILFLLTDHTSRYFKQLEDGKLKFYYMNMVN